MTPSSQGTHPHSPAGATSRASLTPPTPTPPGFWLAQTPSGLGLLGLLMEAGGLHPLLGSGGLGHTWEPECPLPLSELRTQSHDQIKVDPLVGKSKTSTLARPSSTLSCSRPECV